MGKKSAKSRGFRKTKVEKPYLSKKEIGILIACAVAVLAVIVLFATYDDGALKVKDGAFESAETNWLIADCGTQKSHRYFKLGEAGEIEGFTMDEQDTVSGAVTYSNEAGERIAIGASHAKAADLAPYMAEMTASIYAASDLDMGEIKTAQAGDREYSYFTWRTAYYTAPEAAADAAAEAAAEEAPAGDAEPAEDGETAEEQPEPNTFREYIYACTDTIKDASISVQIDTSAESADAYLSEEDLCAMVEKAFAAVTFAEK